MANSRHYDIHGLLVEVTANDDDVAAAIGSRLLAFVAPLAAADLRVDIRIGDGRPASLDELPWTSARPVYESEAGRICYVDEEDLLLLEGRAGWAWARPSAGELTMFAPTASSGVTWLFSHPFLTIPLMEVQKRRAVYSVHAGGVSRDERAVLLAGPSGAGKTTLTIELVRRGLGFLGDDLVFVTGAAKGEEMSVLPFPDEVDLLQDAVLHFPELGQALRSPRRQDWPKHALRLEHIVDVQAAAPCAPVAVVLLGARVSGPPVLDVARAHAALFELAPNVLLTEPASSQCNLDALGRLTRDCPCYTLHASDDLALTAATVTALLDQPHAPRR